MNNLAPSTANAPRPPDAQERRQLAGYLLAEGAYEPDDALAVAAAASVAVFDRYRTDGPGYSGKVVCVIWTGAPSFFDVFTWDRGRLARSDREYDERECAWCGRKDGNLCFDCWRTA